MWDNVIRYVDYGLRWLNVDVSMIRAINENQVDAESLYMEQELPDFTPGLVAHQWARWVVKIPCGLTLSYDPTCEMSCRSLTDDKPYPWCESLLETTFEKPPKSLMAAEYDELSEMSTLFQHVKFAAVCARKFAVLGNSPGGVRFFAATSSAAPWDTHSCRVIFVSILNAHFNIF